MRYLELVETITSACTDLTNDDLLILDATDGALKKVALTNLGFVTDDPTALAIALG